jgi:MFS family permease
MGMVLISNLKSKFLVGSMGFLFVSYFILSFLYHIWAVVITYSLHGIIGAIIALFLPFATEVYLFFLILFTQGFNNLFIFASIAMVVLPIIFVFFSEGGMKKQTFLETNKKEVNGIGGWLIVVIISLIFAILSSLSYIINDLLVVFEPQIWIEITSPDGVLYHPLYGAIAILELVFYTLLSIFTSILLILMFMKKKVFRLLMLIYLTSYLILGTVIALITHNVLISIPYFYENMFNELQDELTTSILRTIISSAIWIPYFLVSKRVKNTFVR